MRTLTVFVAALAASTMASAQQGRGAGMGMSQGPGMGMSHGMGMMMGPAMQATVTGAPYSGVQTVTMEQALPNGNKIERKTTTKVFRDGQGRVRMEHNFTDPQAQARTTIGVFDPVAGVHYMLDPSNKTAVKMPMPAHAGAGRQAAMGRRSHLNAQGQTEDLGTQTINGLVATGTRVTHTIPAGAIGNQQPIQAVRETWTSTELQVPVEIKSTDPRFGATTMELTGVVRAEPDPALFQVPADYTVTTRTPGQRGTGMMQHRAPTN
jgi:hypothetical protein